MRKYAENILHISRRDLPCTFFLTVLPKSCARDSIESYTQKKELLFFLLDTLQLFSLSFFFCMLVSFVLFFLRFFFSRLSFLELRRVVCQLVTLIPSSSVS